MVPSWQPSSLVNHGVGKINRIYALHMANQATSKVSSSTSDIKDGAWLASRQCHQFADRLIGVRAPVMIDLDKTAVLELICIFQAKMAGIWLH
jgi:hypothetical protein